MSPPKHNTAVSRKIGAHAPTVLPAYLSQLLSFKLTLAGSQRHQVSVRKSYTPDAPRGYRIKYTALTIIIRNDARYMNRHSADGVQSILTGLDKAVALFYVLSAGHAASD